MINKIHNRTEFYLLPRDGCLFFQFPVRGINTALPLIYLTADKVRKPLIRFFSPSAHQYLFRRLIEYDDNVVSLHTALLCFFFY